jgi:hypothetical protein
MAVLVRDVVEVHFQPLQLALGQLLQPHHAIMCVVVGADQLVQLKVHLERVAVLVEAE